MNSESIQQKKQDIVERFGEWTNHNIQLSQDVYTVGQKLTGAEVKLKRILQIAADLSGKPFEQLRVLDLACLEGLYGIEFALQGAKVVAVEGREANLEKAKFAKEALGLEDYEVFQDDVRNVTGDKYGQFDVVLCLGIFYHLDAPDVFDFMQKIAEVCQRLAIVDTHVSMEAEKCYVYKDRKYWGRSYREHNPDSTADERIKRLWASLDNVSSFWLTRPSLYNLLSCVGFTSIYECHTPLVLKYEKMRLNQEADRNTFVAIKGRQFSLLSSSLCNEMPQEEWPETEELKAERAG